MKRSRRVRGWDGYGLTLLTLFFFAILAAALVASKPPVIGVVEQRSHMAESGFKIGYFPGNSLHDGQRGLNGLLAGRQDLVMFAGAANLVGTGGTPAPRSFFPVWDAEDSSYAGQYPHIPEEQLPGYGRTAYFVDYGEARFWFLNAARLAVEPSAQLEWLKRTAADRPQLHRIVLLHQEPVQPEVWNGLAASGVDLVLIGERLYAPEAAVTGPPEAGYRHSAHSGWAEWTVSSQPGGAPQLLTVEGSGSRLTAAAPGSAGRAADRLALDAAGLRQAAAGQEQAPVAIGAAWRYRAGSPAVRAVIPPGLDPTGERPMEERVQLPPEDWRSPGYNDADWVSGPAPFGRTRDVVREHGLRTLLPVQAQSPAYYFRKTFVLDEDSAKQKGWMLHVAFEDGFVAYLNGNEIARDSIRDGFIDYRSLAQPHGSNGYELFPLNEMGDLLVQGKNTLAIEVHTSHPNGAEMWFDASLSYQK